MESFLKKYSTVPNGFIEDFFSIVKEDNGGSTTNSNGILERQTNVGIHIDTNNHIVRTLLD